ncbi:hypothetical protein ATANTOWER_016433, partial [Ataeniobius toweri]|nr:hypothetical protein [Ataeniobius toweri]
KLKLIRRLYLNDFPCGNGPWRPTKDDPDGIEKESIDDLLYLLRCPHSPWRHEDVSWSPQASELRELAVLEPSRLNTDFIHNYFTTLIIRGRDVLAIDSGLLKFSKLEELILSVNLISEIPTENLPSTLKGDDSASKLEAASHVTEDESISSDLQPNIERQVSILDTRVSAVSTNETICEAAHLSQYRTSKLTWSDYMNLSYTLTHTVSSLGDLKRFFNQGLCLNLEEEKILSWPAAAEDVPLVKPSLTSKGKKGKKEEQVKSAPTKDKPKDKKSKCAPGLVEDPPIRRVLASAQVLLQSLVQGNQRVSVVCDLRPLNADSEVEAAQTQKDLERKLNGDKKEEDKKPKPGEGRSAAQRNSTALKGKRKDTRKPDVDDPTSLSVPVQQEPVTVELCVELEKWKTASEAHRLMTPAQNV